MLKNAGTGLALSATPDWQYGFSCYFASAAIASDHQNHEAVVWSDHETPPKGASDTYSNGRTIVPQATDYDFNYPYPMDYGTTHYYHGGF